MEAEERVRRREERPLVIACSATTKHGTPCRQPACRGGRCLYHQPEEMLQRLEHKKNRLERRLAAVQADIVLTRRAAQPTQ